MQTQEVVIMAFYFVMSVMSSGHGVVARRSFIEGVLEESRIDSDMFETCRAKGECFSGAWLGTVKHLMDSPLINSQFPGEEILKNHSVIRCEDASFYFFHHMFEVKYDPNPGWGMSPIQTIDLLDFSVLHLSTLERVQMHCFPRGASKEVKSRMRDMLNKESALQLRHLRATAIGNSNNKILSIRKRSMELTSGNSHESSKVSSHDSLKSYFSRTLVIMPFLVTTTGESATTLANKRLYFKLCFDSIFPLFRNIVGAVISRVDQHILQSSRPFREVLLINRRRNDCELPMLALLTVKRMLKANSELAKSFDFIYFTEGDQVLMGRKFPQIFSFLNANPYTVLTPHRLVLLPNCVLDAFNRSKIEVTKISHNIAGYSCCLDTSSHGISRAHWKLLSSHETPILDLFGIHAVAGNAELFRQNYRVCNVTKRVASCPPAVTFNQYPFDDEEKLIFSKNMMNQARVFNS